MTSAAPQVRLLIPALVLLAAAVLAVGHAEGAPRAASVYLAPAGACRAADDSSASGPAQARAVRCLVNWARARDGDSRLHRRSALERAAAIKGLRVASCGQFSHTPCGTAVTVGIKATGYRYAAFGENLFAGTWGHVSARDVVAAWLASPSHRATVLSSRFRHLGVAPVRAAGLLQGSDAVVWTATFASPR